MDRNDLVWNIEGLSIWEGSANLPYTLTSDYQNPRGILRNYYTPNVILAESSKRSSRWSFWTYGVLVRVCSQGVRRNSPWSVISCARTQHLYTVPHLDWGGLHLRTRHPINQWVMLPTGNWFQHQTTSFSGKLIVSLRAMINLGMSTISGGSRRTVLVLRFYPLL